MNQLDLFNEELSKEMMQRHIDAIATHQHKNTRLAWKRKQDKMSALIEKAAEVEQEILQLVLKKQPIMDEIQMLRAEMVKECIHPKDHLAHHGTYLVCRFCERKLSIPRLVD